MLFGWLAVFYTVPEGIAAPYAAGLGGGPAAIGLVLASTVFATMIGTPPFTRFVRPRARASLMGPLAVGTCAALVLTVLRPDLAISLVIFSLSALFGIYQIAANTEFVARVPDERRAQAFGIASSTTRPTGCGSPRRGCWMLAEATPGGNTGVRCRCGRVRTRRSGPIVPGCRGVPASPH